MKPSQTKIEMCLQALLDAGPQGMNRLDALREYNDTCLNSTIAIIANEYAIDLDREYEPHICRYGGVTRFKRYRLVSPIAVERTKHLLDAWSTAAEVVDHV
jgi:hypothetical protein